MRIEVRRVDLRYQWKDTSGGFFPEPVVVLWLHDEENQTISVEEVKVRDNLHLFTQEDGSIKAGRIVE